MRPRVPAGCRESGQCAVQMVLITPALFLMVFLVVQVGMYVNANQVATAAAQEGARVARAADGTAGAARARAMRYLNALGGDTVTAPQVRVTRGPATAGVVVTARAASIIPGLPLTVTGRSSGPVERFHPPTSAGAPP